MFKIITIPFNRNIKAFNEEILNLFLVNKHIKQYRAEFFSDGNEPYWTVFIEYDPVLEQRAVHEKEKASFNLNESQNSGNGAKEERNRRVFLPISSETTKNLQQLSKPPPKPMKNSLPSKDSEKARSKNTAKTSSKS